MAHLLSYARRLQLIRSILSSMQNYWGHIFPLSKKVIKAVESICRKFLRMLEDGMWWIWNCGIKQLFWSSCGPWPLKVINCGLDGCMLTIKREERNMYNIAIRSNTSWSLRKIIDSRSILDDLGSWSNILKNNGFIKHVDQQLLGDQGRVPWRRLINDNKASPKSKFILWMAVKNRLSTTDRLTQWNVPCNRTCCLCTKDNESVEHLFLFVIMLLSSGILSFRCQG